MLSESDKGDLLRLIDSDFFKRVMDSARNEVQTPINNVAAPEMALLLAYEKGVTDVPNILRGLTTPASTSSPLSFKKLNRKPTSTEK